MIRLLGFLLFYLKGVGIQVFLNPFKILVKELFFNEILALLPANAIKTKFLANNFQRFSQLLRNS